MEAVMQKQEEWIREGKTVYSLHESGKFKKGEPELCNKFYFQVQPDYGRGVTDEMAEEQANQIYLALNNHDALVEALAKLHYEYRFSKITEAMRQGASHKDAIEFADNIEFVKAAKQTLEKIKEQ